MADPKWRQFEKAIQDIFARHPDATVERDAIVTGRSGRERRIELLVKYPFQVSFAEGFSVRVPIRIAVDCKDHKRTVGIDLVGQFADQMDDINAPVGIMVSTSGFDDGARARAKEKNIFLIHATWDLLLLAKGFGGPELEICHVCADALADSDTGPGIVYWDRKQGVDVVIWGSCNKCDTVLAFCPDCGAVTGFVEGDYGVGIECTGGCRRVYVVDEVPSMAAKGYVRTRVSRSHLERAIIEAAFSNGCLLDLREAQRLVQGTKWELMDIDGWGLLNFMIEEGWIELEENEAGKDVLRLSDQAREFAQEYLQDVQESDYGS